MPELLGRREIDLPPAEAKTINHKAHAHKRVCSRLYMLVVIGQNKTLNCSWLAAFSPKSAFYI